MSTIMYTYPSYISWKLQLEGVDDAINLFGVKTRKKIRSAHKKLIERGYVMKIESVTEELLEQFYPLYRQNILGKTNPSLKDVRTHIINNMEKNIEYRAASLYDVSGQLIGALLFSVRGDHFSAAYKVFPVLMYDLKLPISVTYVMEYVFFQEAIAMGKKRIIHGMDHNIYGEYSALGLAMFKLQIGNLPYVSKSSLCEIQSEYAWCGDRDVLIFHSSDNNAPITTATLYLLEDNESIRSKYAPILNHSQIVCDVVV